MSHDQTRREFCRSTASLALGAGLVSRSAEAGPLLVQEGEHAIGRHLYKSLKWNMVKLEGTLHEKFSVIKEIGFDGIELDSPGSIDTDEARAASEAVDLPIEGVVNSTHWTIRHSDPDPQVRRQAAENLSHSIQFAARVGASSVLLVPGKVTDAERENHGQVWERSIAAIREMIPLAKRLRILILIENVGNGFCVSPEKFAEYIDTIDSEWVQIHFDIGNHIRISPPAQWIHVLGKRIKKLDVKDRTRQNESTLIGEGEADWPAVRAALNELGYRGWAAAEVTGGNRERLADVLARMNRVLGKSDGMPSSLQPTEKS